MEEDAEGLGAREWSYHLSLQQMEEEEKEMAQHQMQGERAKVRLTTFYHHMFPDLIDKNRPMPEDEMRYGASFGIADPHSLAFHQSTLLPQGCVNNYIPALRPEDVHRGWDSQPKEFDYDLEVEGQWPPDLRGTLFRNGPGLLEVYGTPLVHPIDGDGMVCSLTFNDGKVRFKNKYVKTVGYVLEQKAKRLLFKGMMGTKPPLGWGESVSQWREDIGRGKMPNQRFKNPANTNVYYWGGKLLACWESGLPYLLDPTTLETVGKETLNGVLDEARCLAAHFRYDFINDRLVTFSFQLKMSGRCQLYIHEFDRNWNLVKQQSHELEKYYYCHDFLLTENYYIFHHTPFYNLSKANVAKIISGVASPGQLMRWYPQVPSRMILIPRDEEDHNLRFFDTEPCMIYHHLNAWEEGDKIHFSSVCLGKKFNMAYEDSVGLSNTSVAPGRVINYEIDLRKGTMERYKADTCSCEFPTANPLMNGQRWRYAYLMACDSPSQRVPFQEIVKFDREGTKRQVWSAREEYGVIGEPIYVPRVPLDKEVEKGRRTERTLTEEEEDDGWVMTQLFNCKTYKSEFIVLDAKHIDKGPILRVKLKHHTPYGFHGTFSHAVFE